MFIDKNEKQQIIKTEHNNTFVSNQTDLEICMRLVEILEIENTTLHTILNQILEKQKR